MKKADKAYELAIEKIKDILSDGEVHYIVPLFPVELDGKVYHFITPSINEFHIHASSPSLNRYQLKAG